MDIEKKTVEKTAAQAHLALDNQILEKMAPELSGILTWIEQLSDLDTESVDPLLNVHDAKLPLRKDQITDGNKKEHILQNAPEEIGGYFVVNKIVE